MTLWEARQRWPLEDCIHLVWDVIEAIGALPDARTSWRKARLQCLETFGRECLVCGEWGNHVHHIFDKRLARIPAYGVAAGLNSQQNLCVVCRRCHPMLIYDQMITPLWLLHRRHEKLMACIKAEDWLLSQEATC